MLKCKQTTLMRGKCHLSCGVDWTVCVHSALRHGGKDGETVAGRPAGGTGGTGCPESGGRSPARTKEERDLKKKGNNDTRYVVQHVSKGQSWTLRLKYS